MSYNKIRNLKFWVFTGISNFTGIPKSIFLANARSIQQGLSLILESLSNEDRNVVTQWINIIVNGLVPRLWVMTLWKIFAVDTQFKQLRKRSLKKKFRLQRDSNPWPLRYRCSALPTELWSHNCWEQVNFSGSIMPLRVVQHYSEWACTAVMSNDVMKDLRGWYAI